jgi:hypothetical protein
MGLWSYEAKNNIIGGTIHPIKYSYIIFPCYPKIINPINYPVTYPINEFLVGYTMVIQT